MGQFLFITFNILIIILRTILAIPFIVLKNFLRPLDRRIKFERLNLLSEPSKSFREDNILADYMFHVSSEGELEQVRPIISYFLDKNKKIELVYTSPSVEKKCADLYQNARGNLRIYRLPLASFFPIDFLYFQSLFSFVTAPKVIMCRYDFFPELLLLKYLGKKMILVSAATKKWSWYKEKSINFFDYIVAANEFEEREIKKIFHVSTDSFDFRIPRIIERKNAIEQLKNQNQKFKNYTESLSQVIQPKVILGSMWESEIGILNNKDLIKAIKANLLFINIAPHSLNLDSINSLKRSLEKLLEVNVDLYDGGEVGFKSNVVINVIPAILCESFYYFNMAYIAGGYEKSIHSVLEPFLLGCSVIVGPKIHRSTEFDYVRELAPQEIIILKSMDSFYNHYQELNKLNEDRGFKFDRSIIENSFNNRFLKIISSIENL